jgi:hypothetical protein
MTKCPECGAVSVNDGRLPCGHGAAPAQTAPTPKPPAKRKPAARR